jgi:hypothetical protein
VGLVSVIAGAFAKVPEAAVEAIAERRRLKSAERQRAAELAAERHRLALEALREDKRAASAWELESIRAAGWKDEYWTLALSLPLILCFFPWTAPGVLEGFAVLEHTPEWYRYSVGVAIAAAFGVRPLVDLFRKGRA